MKKIQKVVFLNYRNHAALKKKPYTLLEKSVFLYNFNSRYFKRNILRFFSQKSNKIIRQWEEKSYYREKFIKEYISDNENKLDLFKEIQKEVKAFKKK